MLIPDYEVSAKEKRPFRGVNTFIKDLESLAPGYASSEKNWVTGKLGDHIELRRGMALLGQESSRQVGAGKVTGLGVGNLGSREVPFYSHGRKVKYYDTTDDDVHEVSTDLLPAEASGKDIWFQAYQGLAGSFMFLGSAFSSVFKIPIANPGSAVDQSVTSYRFAVAQIGRGRFFNGQRQGTDGKKDNTSFYLSYIDKATFGQFTQVTSEAIGLLGSSTYSGTLVARTGARTVFLAVFTEAAGEVITDNGDGTLTGNGGSTGTIDYATGAYVLNFDHVTTGNVTADYYWEDSTASGILDYSFTGGGRTAGQGNQFLQADGGGEFMAAFDFMNIVYCLHRFKTWQYTQALDDTDSTNIPYRKVGIPYPRAAWPTANGILIVDKANPSEPKIRRIQIKRDASELTIEPASISEALDLTGYEFDYAICFEFGDWEIAVCQKFTGAIADTYNSVFLMRNIHNGAWDILEYPVSCLATFMGTLLAGDALSNNLYTLFSGFDDDDSPIDNFWRDGKLNLGTDRLKTCHRMVVRGLIQPTQKLKVKLSADEGAYSEVFEIAGDDASYVNLGVNTSIGSYTIGSKVIGGGGGVTAHPYEVDFPIHIERFQNVSVEFEAVELGYVSVDSYRYKDIRDKGKRSLPNSTV